MRINVQHRKREKEKKNKSGLRKKTTEVKQSQLMRPDGKACLFPGVPVTYSLLKYSVKQGRSWSDREQRLTT